MRSKSHKGFLKNQQGAVAATYSLALIPLIAVAGLGFDYARVAGMDTELQNAADQAALAGASQLDRTDGSIERAIEAVRGGLVTNQTFFASDGSTSNIDLPEVSIKFYETRPEAEAGTGSFTDVSRFADAGFVSVTVEVRTANYALTPIVGALSGDSVASAVAGLGSALCRVPPLMICNPDEAGGDLLMDINSRIGDGFLAKPGGGGQWSPGNYGYLDVGLANGAIGVRQALGWGSAGNCIAENGPSTVDTQTGNIANAPGSLNTRFDVYENGACETGGTCPSAINVRKDMVRVRDNAPSSGKTCEVDKTGWELPMEQDAYAPTDAVAPYTNTPKSMGHPRDKCHAVFDGANGSCNSLTGSFGGGDWDRDTYFRAHYGPGWDWQANIPTSAILDEDGISGPDRTIDKIMRYEVYKWEEANAGLPAAGVTVLGDQDYTETGQGNRGEVRHKGRSVCSTQHGYPPVSNPDRRLISVAVVNCSREGVSGNSTNVPVRQWMDVFLVQPSADRSYKVSTGSGPAKNEEFTKKDEVYVEIVRENDSRSTGTLGGITIRRDVPYLVK